MFLQTLFFCTIKGIVADPSNLSIFSCLPLLLSPDSNFPVILPVIPRSLISSS